MEELEIKVIDVCKKYAEEKKGVLFTMTYDYNKKETFFECFINPHSTPKAAGDLFGTIIVRGGKIEEIKNIRDPYFSHYIRKELDNKK